MSTTAQNHAALVQKQVQFVAAHAPPTDCVAGSQGNLQALRDRLKDLVSSVVPVSVVDDLEFLEVEVAARGPNRARVRAW